MVRLSPMRMRQTKRRWHRSRKGENPKIGIVVIKSTIAATITVCMAMRPTADTIAVRYSGADHWQADACAVELDRTDGGILSTSTSCGSTGVGLTSAGKCSSNRILPDAQPHRDV